MVFSTKKFFFRSAFLLCVSGFGFQASQAQQVGASIEFIERNNIDQTAKSIRFAPKAQLLADNANELFKEYLGIDGNDNLMVPKHNTTGKTGMTAMRFTQFYKGIKVEYGGATLSVKNGLVRFLTSNYYTFSNNPSTVPSIAERDAFALATKFVGADLYKWEIPEEEVFIKKCTKKRIPHFCPKVFWYGLKI